VHYSLREMLMVVGGNVALVLAIFVYSRLKAG
jgi:hypothetical protein